MNGVVKTDVLSQCQDKYGGYPITDHAATGIEMARLLHRLIVRTWEPVVLVIREKAR